MATYHQVFYHSDLTQLLSVCLFKMLKSWIRTIWALSLLVSVAQAQFNFFDQMFGGGEQQRPQQQSQNAPSDSSRYQQMWSGGKMKPVAFGDSHQRLQNILQMRQCH